MTRAGIHIRHSLGAEKARERLRNAEEALRLMTLDAPIKN